MTEQEYLDSKNIVTEYVEDFTDRNGWKNISLTTLLKDYKEQLTLTDVVSSASKCYTCDNCGRVRNDAGCIVCGSE
jgi:recombinational DNA repair protein RecR